MSNHCSGTRRRGGLELVSVGSPSASAATAQPAAPAVTWHSLTPINGWHGGQTQFGAGNPAWAVQNGVVYLSGSLHQSSGANANFGVLPPAARPGHTMYLSIYTYGGAIGLLEVDQNGHLAAYDGGARDYTTPPIP
jgi:hypothetical protein